MSCVKPRASAHVQIIFIIYCVYTLTAMKITIKPCALRFMIMNNQFYYNCEICQSKWLAFVSNTQNTQFETIEFLQSIFCGAHQRHLHTDQLSQHY